MKQKLTIKTINSLEPKNKPYQVWCTDLAGFFVRVQPTGVKTYYFYYRNKENQERRYRIGTGLTPPQARDAANLLNADVVKGIDVYIRDKQRKETAQKAKQNTLEAFLNKIYAPYLLEHRRTAKATIKSLETHFKPLMKKQLKDISKWDIQRWTMDKKWTRRSKELKQIQLTVILPN